MLNTEHNLHYYQNLMSQMRDAIEIGKFDDFYQKFYTGLEDKNI